MKHVHYCRAALSKFSQRKVSDFSPRASRFPSSVVGSVSYLHSSNTHTHTLNTHLLYLSISGPYFCLHTHAHACTSNTWSLRKYTVLLTLGIPSKAENALICHCLRFRHAAATCREAHTNAEKRSLSACSELKRTVTLIGLIKIDTKTHPWAPTHMIFSQGSSTR